MVAITSMSKAEGAYFLRRLYYGLTVDQTRLLPSARHRLAVHLLLRVAFQLLGFRRLVA